MAISAGLEDGLRAFVLRAFIAEVCLALSACGGGGGEAPPPPPVRQTTLSCDGYPKPVVVSVDDMQQTFTQVCIILMENAALTPSISASTIVGDVIAHGTDMLSSYYVYARVVAQAADQATATALANGVIVTTANSTVSASPDQVQSPQSLAIDFEIFTAPDTNLTLTSGAAGSVAVDNYKSALQLTTSVGSATLKNVQGQVKVDVGTGAIDVTLTGSGWNGMGMTASTQLGNVSLSRPAAYQGAFTAQTDLGMASIDGNQMSTVTPGEPAVVTVGSGAPIVLKSENGNVSVVAMQ